MNDYRILVVDDEEDLCEILKFNLENEGYELILQNSAEEALMKMDISSYHLILLDVMMGEISGFKMANILKKTRKQLKCLLSLSQQKIPKTILWPDSTWEQTIIFKTFLAAWSHRPCESRIKTHSNNGNGHYDSYKTQEIKQARDRPEVQRALKEGNGSMHATSWNHRISLFLPATRYGIILSGRRCRIMSAINNLKADPHYLWFTVIVSLLLMIIFL